MAIRVRLPLMRRTALRRTQNTETTMKLLHLDSSITGQNSVSRILTAEIVAAQVARHPSIELI